MKYTSPPLEAPVGEDDLQAFSDNRLAPDRRDAVEQFLLANPDVAASIVRDQAIMADMRDRLNFKAEEAIPARLRVSSVKETIRIRRRSQFRSAIAASAILVIGAIGGWTANSLSTTSPTLAFTSVRMADDAIAAYRTYVVEVAHPVEVRASDEAHLVGWLSKRLRSSISAPDLSSFGYRLMGGRLLPAASGPAAMLMYDNDAGSRLTLYIKTGETDDTAFQFVEENGVSAFLWRDRPLGYVITAPVTRDLLLPIAHTVYDQLDSAHLN